jgi:hypothetical protein
MGTARSDSSDLLARSRREQGLPAQLEDDAVIERLATLLSSPVCRPADDNDEDERCGSDPHQEAGD